MKNFSTSFDKIDENDCPAQSFDTELFLCVFRSRFGGASAFDTRPAARHRPLHDLRRLLHVAGVSRDCHLGGAQQANLYHQTAGE